MAIEVRVTTNLGTADNPLKAGQTWSVTAWIYETGKLRHPHETHHWQDKLYTWQWNGRMSNSGSMPTANYIGTFSGNLPAKIEADGTITITGAVQIDGTWHILGPFAGFYVKSEFAGEMRGVRFDDGDRMDIPLENIKLAQAVGLATWRIGWGEPSYIYKGDYADFAARFMGVDTTPPDPDPIPDPEPDPDPIPDPIPDPGPGPAPGEREFLHALRNQIMKRLEDLDSG